MILKYHILVNSNLDRNVLYLKIHKAGLYDI
jgi:hypothetical protein